MAKFTKAELDAFQAAAIGIATRVLKDHKSDLPPNAELAVFLVEVGGAGEPRRIAYASSARRGTIVAALQEWLRQSWGD